jgi:hypothetical protein
MYENNLEKKADRQAACQPLSVRFECSNTDCRANYNIPFSCRKRYCPNCGEKLFNELPCKHLEQLRPLVERMASRRGYVVAMLDFTTVNLGVLPTAEDVKVFNVCIKKFMLALEKKRRMGRGDYGLVYCDEFGGNNTNLHAHGAYVGPVIPRQWCSVGGVLSKMWRQACEGTVFQGSRVVFCERPSLNTR